MSRKIFIGSTQKASLVEVNSSATTWGDLKREIRGEFGDVQGMRAVIRHNRHDLESDGAELPEGEFTIVMSPKKVKAGHSSVDVTEILDALRRKFSNSIDELIDEVEDGDYNKISSQSTSNSTRHIPVPSDVQDLMDELRGN